MIFSTLQWIGLLINHLMGVASEEWQHAKFYTFAKQLMGGGSSYLHLYHRYYVCIEILVKLCLHRNISEVEIPFTTEVGS